MKEYMFIRDELTDSIKKQDTLSNLIITILGVSAIWEQDDVYLLMTVLLISTVLLARIIHYRNVVYYLSSYLAYKEKHHKSCKDVSWENNISRFKQKLFDKTGKSWKKNIFIRFVFKTAGIAKNCGNIILSAIVFWRVHTAIIPLNTVVEDYIIIFASAASLVLTAFFTVIITVDKRIKPEYTKTWYAVLRKKKTNKKVIKITITQQ